MPEPMPQPTPEERVVELEGDLKVAYAGVDTLLNEKVRLEEQYAFVSGEYEDAKRELFDVCVERDGLKEQLEVAREALEDIARHADHISDRCKPMMVDAAEAALASFPAKRSSDEG